MRIAHAVRVALPYHGCAYPATRRISINVRCICVVFSLGVFGFLGADSVIKIIPEIVDPDTGAVLRPDSVTLVGGPANGV